mgnify:CR=1 FL=1
MFASADRPPLRVARSLVHAFACVTLTLAPVAFDAPRLRADTPENADGIASRSPQISARSLRDFFEDRVPRALREHAVAGATVSVVHRGQLVYSQGFGFADRDEDADPEAGDTPVDADRHLFRAASISKLVTWTAVMQLVEAGRLDLDANINDYLRRVPGGYTVPEAGLGFIERPIRLRDLLSHSPGYADRVINLFAADPANRQTLRESVDVRPPPRVLPPGAEIAYSNYGSILAGYIVEIVSEQPFEEYVDANIFAPLGMQSASFVQPLPAPLNERLSEGYVYAGPPPYQNADDSTETAEPNPELFQSQVFEIIQGTPAGGLSISATDMARFLAAHLNGGVLPAGIPAPAASSPRGRRILTAASVRQMHAPLLRPDPRLNGFAHGFMEFDSHGQRIIGHGGDTIFFHSVAAILPEHDLGFFISTNTTTGMRAVAGVKRAFLDHFFGAAAPPGQALFHRGQPDSANLPSGDELDEYAGYFLSNRRPASGPSQLITLASALDVERNSTNDGLLIRDLLTGEQLDCVPIDRDLFQERDGRERFGFLRDSDSGRVRSLVAN